MTHKSHILCRTDRFQKIYCLIRSSNWSKQVLYFVNWCVCWLFFFEPNNQSPLLSNCVEQNCLGIYHKKIAIIIIVFSWRTNERIRAVLVVGEFYKKIFINNWLQLENEKKKTEWLYSFALRKNNNQTKQTNRIEVWV